METDFRVVYETLKEEQAKLDAKMASAKTDAVKHVQELIDTFGIASTELKFRNRTPEVTKAPRKSVAVKYRTPTGVEWTGQGRMKREFLEYLISQGLTEEDKDLFLLPEYEKK